MHKYIFAGKRKLHRAVSAQLYPWSLHTMGWRLLPMKHPFSLLISFNGLSRGSMGSHPVMIPGFYNLWWYFKYHWKDVQKGHLIRRLALEESLFCTSLWRTENEIFLYWYLLSFSLHIFTHLFLITATQSGFSGQSGVVRTILSRCPFYILYSNSSQINHKTHSHLFIKSSFQC